MGFRDESWLPAIFYIGKDKDRRLWSIWQQASFRWSLGKWLFRRLVMYEGT